MTLGGVRGVFRTRLNNLSYREWTDGFNTANIPATILDRSYHLEVGTIQIGVQGGIQYEFSYPVTLRVLSKGFKDPGLAIDAALDNASAILADLMSPSVKLQTYGLKLLRPRTIDTQPLQVSNDNAVMLVMTFNALLIYAF